MFYGLRKLRSDLRVKTLPTSPHPQVFIETIDYDRKSTMANGVSRLSYELESELLFQSSTNAVGIVEL